MSLLSA